MCGWPGSRHVRLALPGRRAAAVGQRGPAPGGRPGTTHPAHRPGDGDPAHRPDRHRLHLLQLPLQPGPQVLLARHPQRWPGRLEHRHHRRRGGSPQLRSRRRARARPAVRAGLRVPRRGPEALGQLGGRRDRRRQGVRCLGRRHEDPSAPAQGDVLQRRGARSTSPARPRVTRCSCRRGRARTARRSRPGTRRPCSPRSRPSRTRRPSTATSSPVRRRSAGTPNTSRCCPGSSPYSGRRRPRRGRPSGSWRTTSCTRTGWAIWSGCCNWSRAFWSWTPRCPTVCRRRARSRAPRAATRSSSSWPGARGSPCGS